MTWWMIVLGGVLLLPFLIVMIGLYVRWVTCALDVARQDMREALSDDEKVAGVGYWALHFVGMTLFGVFLLARGLGG